MTTLSTTVPEVTEQLELWSMWLQRRIIRLLLLHDPTLFRGRFREFYAESKLPLSPLLQQYDRYLRLRTLLDELLEDILPRIRRQLSMQTSQTRLVEEAPTRGAIEWPRTIQRSWRETPGIAPVRFDTRLRKRTTATPENLFVVALLLHVQEILQQALRETLDDEPLSEQELQLLEVADDRLARELGSQYARSLLTEAREANLEEVTARVQQQLRPGPNPYRHLLEWWQRFRDLHVGQAEAKRELALTTRRADEKIDAWHYELWIVLELVHLLEAEKAITPHDTSVVTDALGFTFNWNERRFRFRYNRETEGGAIGWTHGPRSRPDYTIERVEPLEVRHEERFIWREPPVVLDAKYYLTGNDPARTHAPIKKLLGDMVLLGANEGALLFPLLPEPEEGQITRTIKREPGQHRAGMGLAQHIHLYHLSPDMPLDALQERLRAALNQATSQLPERPRPACYGVWLDEDSRNSSEWSPSHNILCPKPHIGPGVFDLVRANEDCLQNPLVCHVIGQAILPPRVVRATTRQELIEHSQNIRQRADEALARMEDAGNEEQAERLRGQILEGVGHTVEQYVKVRGDTQSAANKFKEWVFGQYWEGDKRALSEEARDMLVSGEYVWEDYGDAQLDDWAAPGIQYCRALEWELKRRLKPPSLPDREWSIGSPVYYFENRDRATYREWKDLVRHARQGGADLRDLEQFIKRLKHEVRWRRNKLAHGEPAPKDIVDPLRTAILGRQGQIGMLRWLVEHVEPFAEAT